MTLSTQSTTTSSRLEVVGVGFSGAPNLFYNDGPAKKFSVDLLWRGDSAIRCRFPQLQYADEGIVLDQGILEAKDGEKDVILRPGIMYTRQFRLNEVSFRHNKKVPP